MLKENSNATNHENFAIVGCKLAVNFTNINLFVTSKKIFKINKLQNFLMMPTHFIMHYFNKRTLSFLQQL